MRNGFLLTAAAADPLGDALSGEDVCDGLRTMLSIVIEIPGSGIRFRERRRKWREDAITADEGATMRVGLRQVIFRPADRFLSGSAARRRPPAARQQGGVVAGRAISPAAAAAADQWAPRDDHL